MRGRHQRQSQFSSSKEKSQTGKKEEEEEVGLRRYADRPKVGFLLSQAIVI